MALLDSLFSPSRASQEGPAADFWYEPVGLPSLAGVAVTAETALRVAAVLACVNVLTQTISTLPVIVYEHRPDGGKDRAPNHPIFDVLRSAPNPWMTASEFWSLAVAHRALWGNFYAEIKPGARGFADQLWPLHPDTVTPEVLPDGTMRFSIRGQRFSPARILLQHEVFRVPGLSLDGRVGLSTVRLAREVFGLALAAEGHAARYFGNGAHIGSVLESDANITADQAKQIKEEWKQKHGGLFNSNDVAVLYNGLKHRIVEIDHKKAQLIETRKHEAIEVAQVFRVPPHKIGILDKATFSNIAEQEDMFVRDTIAPWCTAFQDAITRDLILAPKRFFARFLLLGLLRGDPKTRSEFYNLAISGGWMTRNEVREREDMNPLPGLDEPLQPLNMGNPGGAPPPGARAAGHYRELVSAAASRVVRKEVAAVTKAAQRHPQNDEAFAAWARKFYGAHADLVQTALHIKPAEATLYCEGQCTALAADGLTAMETWESTATALLVAIALGETEPIHPTGEPDAENAA